MAIQNAIYTPNRITRKKYFYDPSLEKGILNEVATLGRDSSMDDEDYKDVCFCPENNKLYAVRTNSSSNIGMVDVICPNATVETQSPQASITVGNNANIILYHPSARRIFVIAPLKLSIINPKDNSVDHVVMGTTNWQDPACAVYNPRTGQIFVGCADHGRLLGITPGRLTHSGNLAWTSGTGIELDLENEGYNAITGLRADPDRNVLCLFDGTQERGNAVTDVYSNNIQVSSTRPSLSNDWQRTYTHFLSQYSWGPMGDVTKDVIYCPYDGSSYWLSAPSGYAMQSTVFKMDMSGLMPTREITLHNYYEKLVYCPDNNMIYAIGIEGIQMINPADTYGVTPVGEFFQSGIVMYFNGVCYSPMNNRIYGVGDSGYITYIDPTT